MEDLMRKILILLALIACSAFAESRVHDGFYLNFKSGLGYMNTRSLHSTEYSRIEVENFRGSNAAFRLGGFFNPYVALFGEFSANVATGRSKVYTKDDSFAADVFMMDFLFGPGVVVYPFMNFFVAATVGYATLGISADDYDLRRDDEIDLSDNGEGFGLQIELGKEWWVSPNVSLGIDLSYTLVVQDDLEDDSRNWLSNSLMFRFTFSRS